MPTFSIRVSRDDLIEKAADILGKMIESSPNKAYLLEALKGVGTDPESLRRFVHGAQALGVKAIHSVHSPDAPNPIPLEASISLLEDRILVSVPTHRRAMVTALHDSGYQEVAPMTALESRGGSWAERRGHQGNGSAQIV